MKETSQKTKIIVAIVCTAILVIAFMQYVEPALTTKTLSNSNDLAKMSLMTVDVTLADGTVLHLNSHDNSPASGQQAMSVVSEQQGVSYGQTINNLNTNLYLTPVFTGQIQSYTLSGGSFAIYVNNYNINTHTMSTLAYSTSMSASWLHPSLTSNVGSIVASSTLNTNSVPFTTQYLTHGQYYLLRDIIGTYSISGTFDDGATFGPVSDYQGAEVDFVFYFP